MILIIKKRIVSKSHQKNLYNLKILKIILKSKEKILTIKRKNKIK